MLYNEFIKAGITLEEIELMEHYTALAGLELGEHNEELCFINSETGEVEIEGLETMVKIVKLINLELMEVNKDKARDMDLLKFASELISAIENKARFANANVA